MSAPEHSPAVSLVRSARSLSPGSTFQAGLAGARTVLQGLAFWGGIILAFAAVPLLLAGLVASPLSAGGLLAATAGSLVLGHGHEPADRD